MHSNNKTEQTTLYFSLLREYWPANSQHTASAALHSTLFVHTGCLSIDDTELKSGSGTYIHSATSSANNSNEPVSALRFVISREPIDPENNSDSNVRVQLILCQAFANNLQEAVLRLDQVDFPPGAIAYKNTHPGAGIRYLLDGGLQLESDHDVQHFQAGEAWFEDKNSPVKATAIDTVPSRFVRAMLLPLEFEGKPTLNLLNAEDADKPRLQTNMRHHEHRILLT